MGVGVGDEDLHDGAAQVRIRRGQHQCIVAYGGTTAAFLVEALERSPELTRASVMDTVNGLSDVKNVGLLMPGVTLDVTAKDRFLGETFQMLQYDASAKYFQLRGNLIDDNGLTAKITPENLILG